jgi:hypothetical protein
MEYDNTNKGVLFRVDDDDKKSSKSPDLRGTIDVNGEAFYLSAWRKVSKNNVHYLSLSITPKDAAARPKNETAKSAGGGSAQRDMNDSIPFAPEWR